MQNDRQWTLGQVVYITFFKRLFDFIVALIAFPFIHRTPIQHHNQ